MSATTVSLGVLWAGRLPGPTYEPAAEGSPGLAGFVATFLLALAVIALAVSFTRRMRRASHRDRLRAETTGATSTGSLRDEGAPAGTADGVTDRTADGATDRTADGPDPDDAAR